MTHLESLEKAIELRNQNKSSDAAKILKDLLFHSPNDPDLNYHMAWTCDSMGLESQAIPYYEYAIKSGLSGEDLRGAIIGLGSTLRCIGLYEESLKAFNLGLDKFPEDRAIKVFRSLTLYNLGHFGDSVSDLLVQLMETTSDRNLKTYEKALLFYSDKLNETWK
ncbi:MAG: tetratricopeptide repeat protein [Bdellovibrionales bacterium]|nr:tetratricopeptide repeat protein [Bdellovibrionales bacterium]